MYPALLPPELINVNPVFDPAHWIDVAHGALFAPYLFRRTIDDALFSPTFALAMKAAAVILLMLLVSMHTFSKWMWVMDYELNKAYIARTLCENRAKPMLHCNGKCQLAKKLAADEGNRNTSGSDAPKLNFIWAFAKPELLLPAPPESLLQSNWNTQYLLQLTTAPPTTLLRPPAV